MKRSFASRLRHPSTPWVAFLGLAVLLGGAVAWRGWAASARTAETPSPLNAEERYRAGLDREARGDRNGALMAYRAAAAGGHGLAFHRAGLLLVERDPASAAEAFAGALEHSHCRLREAAEQLAALYDQGRGVPRDRDFAARVRAFDPGPAPRDPHAAGESGDAVPRPDPVRLRRAVQGNDADGFMEFIQAAAEAQDSTHLDEAIVLAAKAARIPPEALGRTRFPRAFSVLGNRLLYGGAGRAGEPAAARRWFEAGARLDDADAWQGLARLHQEGLGGPVDLAKASYARARAAVAEVHADTGC